MDMQSLFGALVTETPQQRLLRLVAGRPGNTSAPQTGGATPWLPSFGVPGGSLPFDRYSHKVKADGPELPPFQIPGMAMPAPGAAPPAVPPQPAGSPPSFPPYAGLINDRSLPPFEAPGSSSQYMPPMRLPREGLPPHMQPFTGLRNEAQTDLPPFVPPGSSLPMDRYMPAPQMRPGPSQPPTMAAIMNPAIAQGGPVPEMTPAAAVMADLPTVNVGGGQQPPEALRLAELEAWRRRAAPWTANFGNFADQRGV